MILDKKDYKDLWDKYFKSLPSAPSMSDYDGYFIRENMLEDYLDIFRKRNTREERAKKPIKWYYEHPFFNKEEKPLLEKRPCIKYILIAEAAPSCTMNSIEDLIYIYNIRRKGGKYLSEPLKSFGVKNYSSLTPIERLLRLASEGVLILDLFPFSINYSTDIRKEINSREISNSFFDNLSNLYSIINRINELKGDKYICFNFDNTKPNTCFIAPPTISHYLADHINPSGCSFLNFRLGYNTLVLQKNIIGNNGLQFNIDINTNPNNLVGLHVNYPINTATIPIYSCVASDGAGYPNTTLIKNTLGLS